MFSYTADLLTDTACRWIWLGYIQSVSTAPRGVLDPVVKGSTELQFVNDEVCIWQTYVCACVGVNRLI